jgi:hypothetical protein
MVKSTLSVDRSGKKAGMRLFNARLALLLVLAAALAPAQAEDVYKWVDAKGVTNYSSAPPADAKPGSKLDLVTQRVSVYTPDAAAQRAAAPAHAHADRALDDRIERLERALEAERQARQYAAAADAPRAAQATYEQCLAQRRVDCDDYGGYLPYAPVVIASVRRRPSAFVPTLPLTGVTAGNVIDALRIGGGAINPTPGAPGARMSALRSLPTNRTGMRFASQ